MENKKLFVYGALMAKHKDKKTAFPAYLEDYEVSFSVKGLKPFEPSFATLCPQKKSKAHGIVIELSKNKLKKLIAHETSYRIKVIEVVDAQGVTHECFALFLKKAGYEKEVVPSARYAHQLYKGGKYHGLPENVLKYYLSLKKKGNKMTYFLRFLFPVCIKLIPYVGREAAFYITIIVVPTLFLGMLIILTLKYFV